MTLNEIAEFVAHGFNDPFNEILKDRIKFTVKTSRAEYIRQDHFRNHPDPMFYQSLHLPVKKVDRADSCIIDLPEECKVLRTVDKIPKYVRLKDSAPFKYVGLIGKLKPFTFTQQEAIPFVCADKYIANIPRYSITNGYIYLYNTKKLKHIVVENVFVDPKSATEKCDNKCDYDDTDDFPIGEDMLRSITSGIIKGEIGLMMPQDFEVNINEQDGQDR